MGEDQGVISGREPMLGSRVRSFLLGVRNILGDNWQSISFPSCEEKGRGMWWNAWSYSNDRIALYSQHYAERSFVIGY